MRKGTGFLALALIWFVLIFAFGVSIGLIVWLVRMIGGF